MEKLRHIFLECLSAAGIIAIVFVSLLMIMNGPGYGADNAAGFDVKNQKEIHLRDHWVLYGDQGDEIPLASWRYYDPRHIVSGTASSNAHLAPIRYSASRSFITGTWPQLTITPSTGSFYYNEPTAIASRVEQAVIRFENMYGQAPILYASNIWLYNQFQLPVGYNGENLGLRVRYGQTWSPYKGIGRASGPEAIFWRYSYTNPGTGPTVWSRVHTGAYLKKGLYTNTSEALIYVPTMTQRLIDGGATIGINIWANTPVDIRSISYYKHRKSFNLPTTQRKFYETLLEGDTGYTY